ncbi:MAG: murein transglycosylase A [Pseudomonadota bacterium]
MKSWLAALALFIAGCTVAPTLPPPAPPAVPALQATTWDALPNWREADLDATWSAFLQSCRAIGQKPEWRSNCEAALQLQAPQRDAIRDFFESRFTPYQVRNPDGGEEGTITGYYEPLLNGSRTPSATYRYPIYAAPDDLLIVDLSSVYPELKSMRLRGRLEGKKVVPYYSREQIESGKAPLQGRELAWVDNAVELFFLQIQGSGRIKLDSGETLRVGYAEQNGYPYKSIGKHLVERGEMTLDQASMQGIKAWAARNPGKLNEVLNYNASYVFFRELPDNDDGPLGALGVPLTPGRSIAVDPRTIPQGAPVFLSTTWPNSNEPLRRLMLAQDTGGAIRGAVRADFFWGFGEEAATQAGKMKQPGRMWVLLPQGYPLP